MESRVSGEQRQQIQIQIQIQIHKKTNTEIDKYECTNTKWWAGVSPVCLSWQQRQLPASQMFTNTNRNAKVLITKYKNTKYKVVG